MNLKTKKEFAQLCGVTGAAITNATRPGKALYFAMVDADGQRIDIEHEDAIAYMDKRRHRKEVQKQLEREAAPVIDVSKLKRDETDIELADYETGDRSIANIGDNSLNWFISKFRTAQQFERWVKGLHETQKLLATTIKNKVSLKQLVSTQIIGTGIINPVLDMCKKLLTDCSKTMAIRLHNY